MSTLHVIHEVTDYDIVGTGHIQIALDSQNVIMESNEINNLGMVSPLTFTPPLPCE
jgi:hypothetical protein